MRQPPYKRQPKIRWRKKKLKVGERVCGCTRPDAWGVVTAINQELPDPAFCTVVWDADPKQKPREEHCQSLRTHGEPFNEFQEATFGKGGKYLDPKAV